MIFVADEIKKSAHNYERLYSIEEWKVFKDLVTEQFGIFESTREESLGVELNRNLCQLMHGYDMEAITNICQVAENMNRDFIPVDLKPPTTEISIPVTAGPSSKSANGESSPDSAEEQTLDPYRRVMKEIKV